MISAYVKKGLCDGWMGCVVIMAISVISVVRACYPMRTKQSSVMGMGVAKSRTVPTTACAPVPYSLGEACEAKCPGTHMDNGAVVMCNGHGTCSDDKCICSKGYYGEDCGQSCPGLLEDAETLECNGNGVCNPSTLQCECINETFESSNCRSPLSLPSRRMYILFLFSRHL